MNKSDFFDSKELDYLHNTDFLLTKRKLTEQLQHILSLSQQQIKQAIADSKASLPANCLQRAGKISRGENYRGLPYLILDYPRLLAKNNVFSFRSMFWWGHFFSCTLHLQGQSLQLYRSQLQENILEKATALPADTWICVNNTPWEYHYEPSNYKLLKKALPEELRLLLDREFVKLSRKMPLQQYEQLPAFSSECLQQFLHCLRPS
jgi:hypothetical protein